LKIIISCCDRKNGGPLIHNGEVINFVSHVDQVVPNDEMYFHPDDLVPNEDITWRELVRQQGLNNNLQLAHELYRPSIYNSLFQNYGNDLFIISAGWGIIRADYRLPKYNVTFSNTNIIPNYARRNHGDIFHDCNHLEGIEANERIIVIAGSDYVLPFCQLTEDLPNEKIIIYKNQNLLNNNPYLDNNNFQFQNYQTNRRTNWHYEFAERLMKNEIEI
jgi:hypothetical protein